MYSISEAEIKILNTLKSLVLNNTDFLEIKKKTDEIATLIDDVSFPYIYSAVLLAAENRVEDSLGMFRLCNKGAFLKIISEYLKKNGALIPNVKVFKDSAPYSAWIKTDFAKSYTTNTVNSIHAFYHERIRNQDEKLTILDIGTGNGILITDIINRILDDSNCKQVELILLDKFPAMLEAAGKYCKKHIQGQLKITEICCEINKITEKQIEIIKAKAPVSFINCALSIHHFPWETKILVLQKLKLLSDYCVISDLNFNHDIPDKYSPELIYAVYVNMECVFSDILTSNITENEKKLAIEEFFLAETINIICQDRNSRIDYHTKIRHWKNLSENAGISVNRIYPTVVYGKNRIATFTMALEL